MGAFALPKPQAEAGCSHTAIRIPNHSHGRIRIAVGRRPEARLSHAIYSHGRVRISRAQSASERYSHANYSHGRIR